MIYQLSDAYSHADIYYCPIIDVYTAYTCGEICSTRVLGIIQLLMHTLHMHAFRYVRCQYLIKGMHLLYVLEYLPR